MPRIAARVRRWGLMSLLAATAAASLSLHPAPAAAATSFLGKSKWNTFWVKEDGRLFAWGYNTSGQLGVGDRIDRSVPTEVSGMAGVVSVAGGEFQTVAVLKGGTAWSWGSNGYGQLGLGHTVNKILPNRVPITNAATAAAGDSHILIARTDGTVWGSGLNSSGQLGDGTTTNRLSPVKVAALVNVVAVAAGTAHSLALRSDGTVWAWGNNAQGQLGDGTTTNRNTPVQVQGLTGVVAISNGTNHNLALKSDGTVWGWGVNTGGELGDNTTTSRSVPVQVPGLAGIVEIAAGGSTSLARRGDGVVLAWGVNYGQFGTGVFSSSKTPITATGITGATALTVAVNHMVFLRADGSAWSSGTNTDGVLGDASTITAPAPVPLDALTGVSRIAAGYRHSVAVLNDGTVVGFGDNIDGALGDGTTTLRGTPTPAIGLTGITDVGAGSLHSVALRSDGTVWAMGHNGYGQMGDGTTTRRLTPVMVSGLTGVVAIAAGYYHNLALRNDGSVWAWGRNQYGQLGDGTKADRNVPVRVNGLSGITKIAAGGTFNFAVKADGTVVGWGLNWYGNLGNGTGVDSLTPVAVTGLTGIIQVAAAETYSMALKSDGTVWSWGGNFTGNLAIGSHDASSVPVRIPGLSGVTAIAIGRSNAYAVTPDGSLYGWGMAGLNGDGTSFDVVSPSRHPFVGPVSRVASGYDFTLVQTRDGKVVGWGNNFSQKLLVNFATRVLSPIRVRDPYAPYANADLVVEYFNSTITNINGATGFGHYFITAAAAEQASIDKGGSGPGWFRTGRVFWAWNDAAKAPAGAVAVHRFYTRTSNSHFYTASPAEYQDLRAQNPTNDASLGWAYEGVAFHTVLPGAGGQCAPGYFPIYRAYNKRFLQSDSNHRISPSLIDARRAIDFLGYADEGVALCSPNADDARSDLHAWYVYPGAEVQSGGVLQTRFIFANLGPGKGDGGRIYMSLPREVTNWTVTCAAANAICPTALDAAALRAGQPVTGWAPGGVITLLATGTAPAVATGGNATLDFSAVATPANGAADGNEPNNAPPSAQMLVKAAAACNFSVSPAHVVFGTSTQAAQLTVRAGNNCAWTVQEDLAWLTTSTAGGTGNGTVVLTPQANTSSLARSAGIIVAGLPITVAQAGVPCTFSAAPASVSATAAAQTKQVAVTGVAGCDWTTASTASWVSVAPTSGTGSGTLTLTLQANAAAGARNGAINIGGLEIPVAQAGTAEAASVAVAGGACDDVRLQREGEQISAAGMTGEGSVAIFAADGCAWASQSRASWLTLTAGGSGSGNGTLRYVAQPNADPAVRTATITVATKVFTVTQQGSDVPTSNGSEPGGDTSGGGAGTGGDSGGSSGGDSG